MKNIRKTKHRFFAWYEENAKDMFDNVGKRFGVKIKMKISKLVGLNDRRFRHTIADVKMKWKKEELEKNVGE